MRLSAEAYSSLRPLGKRAPARVLACGRDSRSVVAAAVRRPSCRDEVDLLVAAGRGPAHFRSLPQYRDEDPPECDTGVDPDLRALWRLLATVPDPNVAYEDGFTPLHLVCQSGHGTEAVEAAELLLKAGADPNARTAKRGHTPLDVLFSQPFQFSTFPQSYGNLYGHSRLVEVLLRGGAKPNTNSATLWSAIALASDFSGRAGCYVRREGEEWDEEQARAAAEAEEEYVEEEAAKDDVVAVVRALLRGGADPNTQDESGAAPLHAVTKAAGSSAGLRIIASLLEAGADPHAEVLSDAGDEAAFTSHWTAEASSSDDFDDLVGWDDQEEGASSSSSSRGGGAVSTPLTNAISFDNREHANAMAKLLLPYIDPDRSNTLLAKPGTSPGEWDVTEVRTPLDLAEAIVAATEQERDRAAGCCLQDDWFIAVNAARETAELLRAHGLKRASELS